MSIREAIFEQIPALLSGLFSSIVSLRFGGNIKGGLRGAIESTVFTTLLAGSVIWFIAGIWLYDDLVARFAASVILGSFSYPVFFGFRKLVKSFVKNPLGFIEKFKK